MHADLLTTGSSVTESVLASGGNPLHPTCSLCMHGRGLLSSTAGGMTSCTHAQHEPQPPIFSPHPWRMQTAHHMAWHAHSMACPLTQLGVGQAVPAVRGFNRLVAGRGQVHRTCAEGKRTGRRAGAHVHHVHGSESMQSEGCGPQRNNHWMPRHECMRGCQACASAQANAESCGGGPAATRQQPCGRQRPGRDPWVTNSSAWV